MAVSYRRDMSTPDPLRQRAEGDPSRKYGVFALPDIASLFTQQSPISLEATNRKAKMLNRIDRKYVLNCSQFRTLMAKVAHQYAVLEIDDLSQFAYKSCYYDDHFSCYFEHHQARRQRFKVRTREYVDSGLRFYEIKLKGLRGQTRKHRVKCDRLVMPKIGGEHLDLLHDLYLKQYKKPLQLELKPSLIVGYTRCTLVAILGSERVTVDYGLSFKAPTLASTPVKIGNDFIIVETKSRDGMGVVDCHLKDMGIRKASKCSKYCIGVNLIGCVNKNNYFLPTLRRVRKNIVGRSAALVQAAV